MVNVEEILQHLTRDLKDWQPETVVPRHEACLAAAELIKTLQQHIVVLEQQLAHAKTAALVDVAKAAAVKKDWVIAQQVLSYMDKSKDLAAK